MAKAEMVRRNTVVSYLFVVVFSLFARLATSITTSRTSIVRTARS
jgi:hypothetical protein